MRKTYIDNLRWITVVLVVIYHVIYLFNGVMPYGVIGPFYSDQPQDLYAYVVYPWFMLLLFVISGMTARFDLERRTEKEFFREKTGKLLVPSTLGLLLSGWILGYYNMAIGNAFMTMPDIPKPVMYLILCVSGTGVLWYIQCLWLFSVLLLLIRKIEKDRLFRLGETAPVWILPALFPLIYGAAQVGNTPIVVVYRFGIYGAGYLIGYFLLSHETVMERLGKTWIFFTFPALVIGIAFVLRFQGSPYPEHVVLDTWLCNLYAWLGTLGMLSLMKRFGDFRNSFTVWMTKTSWDLYLFHYLPIAMTGFYLHRYAPDLSPALVYLLTALAGFAGAYLLGAVIRHIPGVRWCLMGIGKEKQKE